MPFPTVKHCMIADAAHAEGAGKLALIGFLGIAPDVEVGISDFSRPLGLAFVLLAGDGDGKRYGIQVEVVREDGTIVMPKSAEALDVELKAGKTILSPHVMAVYPGPGRYVFRLIVDGQPFYENTFKLLVGQAR